MLNLINYFYKLFQKKDTMILSMLANTLLSIAADKMQSAAKEHILKAVNDNLDDDAKKALDQAISDDKGHNKNNLMDLLS